MRWFFEWLQHRERRRACPVCAQLREELGRTREERDWFRDNLLEKQVGVSPSTPETDSTPQPEAIASTFEELIRADEQAEIEERAREAVGNPLIYAQYLDAAVYDPAYEAILTEADKLKANGQ